MNPDPAPAERLTRQPSPQLPRPLDMEFIRVPCPLLHTTARQFERVKVLARAACFATDGSGRIVTTGKHAPAGTAYGSAGVLITRHAAIDEVALVGIVAASVGKRRIWRRKRADYEEGQGQTAQDPSRQRTQPVHENTSQKKCQSIKTRRLAWRRRKNPSREAKSNCGTIIVIGV
jgi:hypothetical protein